MCPDRFRSEKMNHELEIIILLYPVLSKRLSNYIVATSIYYVLALD